MSVCDSMSRSIVSNGFPSLAGFDRNCPLRPYQTCHCVNTAAHVSVCFRSRQQHLVHQVPEYTHPSTNTVHRTDSAPIAHIVRRTRRLCRPDIPRSENIAIPDGDTNSISDRGFWAHRVPCPCHCLSGASSVGRFALAWGKRTPMATQTEMSPSTRRHMQCNGHVNVTDRKCGSWRISFAAPKPRCLT